MNTGVLFGNMKRIDVLLKFRNTSSKLPNVKADCTCVKIGTWRGAVEAEVPISEAWERELWSKEGLGQSTVREYGWQL